MREYEKRVMALLDLLLDRLCAISESGFTTERIEEAKRLASKMREVIALEGEDGGDDAEDYYRHN